MRLPARFAAVIPTFAPVFRQQRTWRHARLLPIGAVLVPGKRTVTSLLRIAGRSRERRFTNHHRVLNRAAWASHAAARLLLGLLIAAFAPNGPVVLGIDETIERRRAAASASTPRASTATRFAPRSATASRAALGAARLRRRIDRGDGQRPALAQPEASGSNPLGGAHSGAPVPCRARTLGALLPQAWQAAQETDGRTDGLGAANGLTSTPLAARARDRAAGRQQLRRFGLPGDIGSARNHRHHPPAAGRGGAVRTGAAAQARDGRAPAHHGRAPVEPRRRAGG